MALDDTIEIVEFKVAEATCSCGWSEKASTVEYAVLLAAEHRLTHDGSVITKMRKAHSNEQWYLSPR